jgi:DNA-binding CsgD family transcriptional regulator
LGLLLLWTTNIYPDFIYSDNRSESGEKRAWLAGWGDTYLQVCWLTAIFKELEQIYPLMNDDDSWLNEQLQTAIPLLEKLPGIVIVHNLKDWSVAFMSRKGMEYLRVTKEELDAMGADYHKRFFNAEESKEYVPKVLGMLERNNDDESLSVFQQVRADAGSDWNWFFSTTGIFLRDENRMPLLVLTIAVPVVDQHLTSKVERLLDENNFLRRNKHVYASLTRREVEILALMAKDASSAEMAATLYISEDTVKTHRKNIRRKIGAENQYDVVRFAQAFDVI